MTSGVRQLINEVMIWLGVFIIALGGFWYLDDRISAFVNAPGVQAEDSDEHYVEEEEAETERPAPQSYAQRRRQAALQQQAALRRQQQQAEEDEYEDEGGYGRVVLHAERSGHFEVNARINNRHVELMADTGATKVVLSYADARSLGITGRLRFTGRAHTANGVSRVAPITLDSVQVGDIKLYDVHALVAETGKLSTSLLGMSFIGRLERFEMSGKRLVLVK